MSNRFKVIVPATTANIGSGFDSAGIALSLYNVFEFDFSRENGLEFENIESRFATADNLVYQTCSDTLKRYGKTMPADFYLKMETNIPVARGLGSSSTCIIAGIYSANIYGELSLTVEEIAALATEIEGHPDNVVPAIVGGMVSSVVEEQAVFYKKILPHESLKFIVLVEDNEVSTHDARAVMPEVISYEDAIYNISRSGLLLSAFERGNHQHLKVATQDRLHQQYRAKLIKTYGQSHEVLVSESFITHWISGSGSTVIGLLEAEQVANGLASFAEKKIAGLDVQEIAVDVIGVRVESMDI